MSGLSVVTKRRSEQGGVILESIIGLPVFLVLAFMGIELMILAYKSATIQYIASESVRKVALGICDGPALNGGQGQETTSCTANSTSPPHCIAGGTLEGLNRCKRAYYAIKHAEMMASRLGLAIVYHEACVGTLDKVNGICGLEGGNRPVRTGGAAGEIVAMRVATPVHLLGGAFHLGGGKVSGYSIARVERVDD